MTEGLKIAVVAGLLLIVAALLLGGLYASNPVGQGNALVLNRLTGAAWVCRPAMNWKCLPAGEAPPKPPHPPLDLSGLKPVNPFDRFDAKPAH